MHRLAGLKSVGVDVCLHWCRATHLGLRFNTPLNSAATGQPLPPQSRNSLIRCLAHARRVGVDSISDRTLEVCVCSDKNTAGFQNCLG